ncbi:MAG: HNH endonuclease [Ruminococcaceae bacterium]|nr:HNH endonuclease [Oscillospiraceae bacterium]
MKTHNFKNHCITRSSPPHKSDYHEYKVYLKKDFCERCAYCNLRVDYLTTTPFQIDHFIPKKAFDKEKPELLTDYNNLIYSCSKCNNAKRAQFEGDLTATEPTNELFYDPVKTDYNTIFYRNELGAIDSDDEKGKDMIKRLKLYRPIHMLAWICEQLDETITKTTYYRDHVANVQQKDSYDKALLNLNEKYREYTKLFISAYNNEDKINSFLSE